LNEHSFIRSVHRRLPKEVYRWKINDNFAGGVADAYYSGNGGDLWIEYKYVKLPKRDDSKVTFGTSAQQRLWLTERLMEGRNVLLVVGSAEGVLITNDVELIRESSSNRQDFISNAACIVALTNLICELCIKRDTK